MAVVKSPTSVGLETGETISILSENFSGFQNAFTLYDVSQSDSKGYLRVVRDHPDGNKIGLIGWGAGVRALFLTGTVEKQPTGRLTPVIALVPNQENSKSGPLIATVIESAVDPVIKYLPTQKKFTLYYWVNTWSPPPKERVSNSDTLFSKVRPPDPLYVDSDYLYSSGYAGPQPESRFTTVRDVPSWYQPGQAPETQTSLDLSKITIPPLTGYPERVGPADQNRFWVAPFTDAHLFRFPDNYDPLPGPASQNPVVPPSPPSPPPPPAVVTQPSANLIGSFPYLVYPSNQTTQELNGILFSVKNGISLRNSERSTLDVYAYALNRLAGLARCSRVLMQTEGQLFECRKRDDSDMLTSAFTPVVNSIENQSNLYLVVNHPRPVLSLPRGINKVLVGRPKMTSYLGDSVFVTAALTYKYPASASVSLCGGNPQVDFTIQCPSDHFDEYKRMGVLPESTSPQQAPYIAGATLKIPGPYGTSLIEVLSNMSIW